MNKKYFSQQGQTGVIVLFIAVILVTIGLSIASRNVSDINISRQEDETTRAYNVAEAGIEEVLRQDLAGIVATGTNGCGGSALPVDGIDANYLVCESTKLKTALYENEAVGVKLGGFPNNQGIRIEWGEAVAEKDCEVGAGASNSRSAIVVAFVNSNLKTVRREAYDICASARANNFTIASTGTVPYESQIDNSTSAFMKKLVNETEMRVRVLYGPQTSPASRIPIRISGNGSDLPVQYYTIKSEARTIGGETRAVEVTKTLPSFPSIFDFAIFTESGIIK